MPDAKDELGVLGGSKAVQTDPGDMFTWPIITEEDEAACATGKSTLRKELSCCSRDCFAASAQC